MSPTCENEVVRQLLDLQRRAADLSRRDGRIRDAGHLVTRCEQPERALAAGRAEREGEFRLRLDHLAGEPVPHLRAGDAQVDGTTGPEGEPGD
jgi:hypothetical protein